MPKRLPPPTDTNLLKHGIYTRFIPLLDEQHMQGMDAGDLSDELAVVRVHLVHSLEHESLADDESVRTQYRLCQCEVLPGPARTLRWGVKDGTRGPDGLLVHDDYILADSLVAILDAQKWTASTLPVFKENRDVFDELREEFGEE